MKKFTRLFPFLIFGLFAAPVFAEKWALDGYDPVSLRSGGHAVPGRQDISVHWKGAMWHFSTLENRTKFEGNPTIYMPEFKGYCPVALSTGTRIKGDPRHGVVVDGRIYLMRSAHEERQFEADAMAILQKAAKNWAR